MVPGFVGTAVWAAALALSALWAVGVVALALGTRHRAPVAGPPTADLPPAGLPPGVVAYLTQDLVVGEDAVESTLVDLAARGHVDLRQADRDPRSTTVHLTGHRVAAGDHLLPFEEQVLGRVGAVVRGGVAPVAALRARGGEDVAGWWRAFAAHVRAAARSAGLTRPRVPVSRQVGVVAAAGPAALSLGAAAGAQSGTVGDALGAAAVVTVLAWGAAAGAAGRLLRGETLTEAGRAQAGAWLGLAAFLRGDSAFAAQPPAAVAVWDRYLAYGDALGVTTVVRSVLDFGLADRRRVWSAYGGTWRVVRVRYPRGSLFGTGTPTRVVRALFQVPGAAVLLSAAAELPAFAGPADRVRYLALSDVAALGALGLVGSSIWLLGTAVLDLAGPRVVVGEVLWISVARRQSADRGREGPPQMYHLAVDDGTTDRTRAWALLPGARAGVAPADRVRLTVRRWSRRVLAVEVLASPDTAAPSRPGADDVRTVVVEGPLGEVAWRLLVSRPLRRPLGGAGADAYVDGDAPARWAVARAGDRVATLALPLRPVTDEEVADRLRSALAGRTGVPS
ncbi:DUF2207 domain-containing protein [Kineosporia sp. R_H_3]|uniref:DUF2207 family protein n=1 Tax=Kineosporia sp. R_H_3 TaxID=1961848 RepID=UPI00117A4C7A|nr:DUF2207 domain-containing protein [Kineosporia sp. R_H_3]